MKPDQQIDPILIDLLLEDIDLVIFVDNLLTHLVVAF
jgi:hypothetical protein